MSSRQRTRPAAARERARQLAELRRSHAAGPHGKTRKSTRAASRRDAIRYASI
jgi:hypothetical protein